MPRSPSSPLSIRDLDLRSSSSECSLGCAGCRLSTPRTPVDAYHPSPSLSSATVGDGHAIPLFTFNCSRRSIQLSRNSERDQHVAAVLTYRMWFCVARSCISFHQPKSYCVVRERCSQDGFETHGFETHCHVGERLHMLFRACTRSLELRLKKSQLARCQPDKEKVWHPGLNFSC